MNLVISYLGGRIGTRSLPGTCNELAAVRGEWEAGVEALNDRSWVDKEVVAGGCGFLQRLYQFPWLLMFYFCACKPTTGDIHTSVDWIPES